MNKPGDSTSFLSTADNTEEVQKRGEKIKDAIYRISEAAHSAQSLSDLYRAIHNIIAELMPATNFYIAIHDPDSDTLSFPYFVDEHEPPPPPRKRGRGLTEYVLRAGSPLLAPPEVERELVARGEVELLGPAAVDWLGVPLKARNNIIGVLVIQSYAKGIRFGIEEQNILIFVSTQIAMAIERKQAEEALLKSEERYRIFVQHISEGIWRTEMEQPISIHLPVEEQIDMVYKYSHIAECNDMMARMYGYDIAEKMVGIPVRDLLIQNQFNRDYERTFIHNRYRIMDAESQEVDRQGNKKYFLNNSIGIVRDGYLWGVWGTQRDITERKVAEEALRDSEERYRLLFERNLAGVFRSAEDGKILDCNESFARMFGYHTREELLLMPAWELYHETTDRQALLRRLQQQNALSNLELRLKKRDGSDVWVLANINLLISGAGSPIIEGTLVDITDRKNAEEQIAYQAYHDALTGLANRTLFRDRLNQALAHSHRHKSGLAVLFLDLDHFKLINDTLGHSIGDWLLTQISSRLRQTIREMDTVARLGGDEFILLLPEIVRNEDAARVAQKILNTVAQPLPYESHDLYITTSIGIALNPADGTDAETLIRCADSAMYRAKELGRNNYQLWSPALNARIHERMSWERNIRRAVERNEFTLYYQPQLSLQSGNITGVEALIRWKHPEKGIVLPMEFIPLAEETRLILPIGEWLLKEACRQVKEWQEHGHHDLRLSLNLSARQFQQQDLIELLQSVLNESGLSPSSLVLEIIETVAMQNIDYALAVLHTLRRMGVRIALDDFGMGYSSLSYLKHFPIDIIKIDPSFVKNLGTGNQEEALVRAIIQLGHSLNQTIIAEGVEEERQRQFLEEETCEEIQGYLLSKALAPAELESFLSVHTAKN